MKKLIFFLVLIIVFIFIGLHFWHNSINSSDLSYSLREAAWNNDLKTAEKLISQGADINKRFEGGNALEVAIKKGNVDMVKFLVSHGAHVYEPETDRFQARSLLDNAIMYAQEVLHLR